MTARITPDVAQTHLTLLTAAARFDELSLQDALASMAEDDAAGGGQPLARDEALELLALGEAIARKAAYGRQLTVRSARAAGASWSQIGAALGISKQAAWEAHGQWIEDQALNGTGAMAAAAWTRTWLEWHGCWPDRPVLTMNDEHRWMTGVYRDFGYPGAAGSRRNLAAAQADSSSRAPNASTGPSAPAARTPSVAALPAAQARTSAVNE